MAIQKITAGQGLVGGGTSSNVNVAIDVSVVPQLDGGNAFTGNQTVNGDMLVGNTLTTTFLAVNSADLVPNLNANLLENIPASGFAKTGAHNTFDRGQTINGSVVVSGNSVEINPYPEFGMSQSGVIGFGCNDYTNETPEAIPEAGAGVVGMGGYQINPGSGTGGCGVFGLGGDQIGFGGGGSGVSGFGGDGSDGQWGGNGGDFLGGAANNGSGGPGIAEQLSKIIEHHA